MSKHFNLNADYDFINVVDDTPTCMDCGYILGTNEGLITGLCVLCEDSEDIVVDVWGEDLDIDEEGIKYLVG